MAHALVHADEKSGRKRDIGLNTHASAEIHEGMTALMLAARSGYHLYDYNFRN